MSKGSFIYDDGTLTFSGGAAQANVTFLAYGTERRGWRADALQHDVRRRRRSVRRQGGLLVVSAAPGGTITFSAGTVVGATANSTIEI